MKLLRGSFALGWDSRRKRSFPKRKKQTMIRLGGGPITVKQRRGSFLLRMMRRIKLRWLKRRYFLALKKLKGYYRGMVKDFVESGANLESFQARALIESSFTVPGLTASLSTYPAGAGRHG